MKVFEWGPEDGEKVLLMHGIGTPCLALADLAQGLVDAGHRVTLFDFFGQGYSDAPCDVPYDLRLYTSQMLLVLASSKLAWTGDNGFHLIGYSLGSGVAVSFTRYFAHMVQSLVLVAGSRLIRRDHVSWKSKILYSSGISPEPLLQYLVKKRITPQQNVTEEMVAAEAVKLDPVVKKQKNSDASGGNSFDNVPMSTRRPGHTVASVISWQLEHHRGFVHAFMSSLRHAPIYDQKEDWREVGKQLADRRMKNGSHHVPGLLGGKILLALGSSDPVILKDELIHDAKAVLGEDGFEIEILDGGHEIAIARGAEVARAVVNFWRIK